MALRNILALSFTSPQTLFVLEFYLTSPPDDVALTLAGLSFDLWLRCLAIKRIMNSQSTEYIVYENQVKRTTIGSGYITMISLIAAGLIERVLVEKVDHSPARFMQLLISLCQERNTEIVSVKDYGKDVQLVA